MKSPKPGAPVGHRLTKYITRHLLEWSPLAPVGSQGAARPRKNSVGEIADLLMTPSGRSNLEKSIASEEEGEEDEFSPALPRLDESSVLGMRPSPSVQWADQDQDFGSPRIGETLHMHLNAQSSKPPAERPPGGASYGRPPRSETFLSGVRAIIIVPLYTENPYRSCYSYSSPRSRL